MLWFTSEIWEWKLQIKSHCSKKGTGVRTKYVDVVVVVVVVVVFVWFALLCWLAGNDDITFKIKVVVVV
jgi:hypothetical protein